MRIYSAANINVKYRTDTHDPLISELVSSLAFHADITTLAPYRAVNKFYHGGQSQSLRGENISNLSLKILLRQYVSGDPGNSGNGQRANKRWAFSESVRQKNHTASTPRHRDMLFIQSHVRIHK
jgi:hypothetical protein